MYIPAVLSYNKSPDGLEYDFLHSKGEFSCLVDISFEKHLTKLLYYKSIYHRDLYTIQFMQPCWYSGVCDIRQKIGLRRRKTFKNL